MLDLDLFPLLNRVNRTWAARYEAKRRAGMRRFLETVDPDALEHMGKVEAVKAFQRAAGRTVFYSELLKHKGIDPRSVQRTEDFWRLPVLEKQLFAEHPIIELVRDSTLSDAKNILTSSGFSGLFSFGINMQKNLENTARLIDAALDIALDITHRKTILINCLPMGVKAHTNATLLAEVSVREDMALALIKKFGMHYDQVIIVGEAFFLKFLVEQGIEEGIDWKKISVNLIAGEDSFPENYRDYMASLIGLDIDARPSRQIIGSSLGVAELDLNLFHETADTVRIRREAERNETFRKALFGETKSLPMLFHYYPHRTYLEQNTHGEIIVTMTSPYLKIPLIRYNAKDTGKTISYRTLEGILREQGKLELLPSLHLPLVAIESRASNGLNGFHADFVRHAIFSDPRFPPLLTGHFKLTPAEGGVHVRLHLKPGVAWKDTYTRVLEKTINRSGTKVTVEPVPYHEFTEGLVLDYNKKFNHV